MLNQRTFERVSPLLKKKLDGKASGAVASRCIIPMPLHHLHYNIQKCKSLLHLLQLKYSIQCLYRSNPQGSNVQNIPAKKGYPKHSKYKTKFPLKLKKSNCVNSLKKTT